METIKLTKTSHLKKNLLSSKYRASLHQPLQNKSRKSLRNLPQKNQAKKLPSLTEASLSFSLMST